MKLVFRDDANIKHYLKFVNGYPVECKWYKKLNYSVVDFDDYAKSEGYRSYLQILLKDNEELNDFLDCIISGDIQPNTRDMVGTVYSIKSKRGRYK